MAGVSMLTMVGTPNLTTIGKTGPVRSSPLVFAALSPDAGAVMRGGP